VTAMPLKSDDRRADPLLSGHDGIIGRVWDPVHNPGNNKDRFVYC
jgi:hypothetical protein